MASGADLQLVITAKNETTAAFRDAKRDAEGLGSSMKGIAAAVGSSAITSGLKSIGSELSNLTKGAAEDAASQARLQKAITNTGASYAAYGKTLEGVISKGQQLGFTDDQVRDSLSLLTAQTGNAGEATKRFALAQDLARGANIDVVTASKLLGKVTDENVNVLNRYGISVKKGASETDLFAAVQQKFGGQAKEFGDSVAGAAARNKIAMDEMRESMGAKLLPVMSAFTSGFQAMPAPMQTAVAALGTFGPALGQMAIGVGAIVPMLGRMASGITSLIPLLVAGGPAALGLAAGIGIAYGASKLFASDAPKWAAEMGALTTTTDRLKYAQELLGQATNEFEREALQKLIKRFEEQIEVSKKAEERTKAYSQANQTAAVVTETWDTKLESLNDTLTEMTRAATDAFGALDKFKNVPTQEQLNHQAALSSVNQELAFHERRLLDGTAAKVGDVAATQGYIAFLQEQKAVLEAVSKELDANRQATIDMGQAKVGASGNVAGLTKTELELNQAAREGAGALAAQGSAASGAAPGFDAAAAAARRLAAALREVLAASGGFTLNPENLDEFVPPGSLQSGTDFVPRTGLYMLHKGEAVVPAEENAGSHHIPPNSLQAARSGGFALNIYGPLTVQNIGPQKDTRRVMGDLAFTMAAEMRARGILAA